MHAGRGRRRSLVARPQVAAAQLVPLGRPIRSASVMPEVYESARAGRPADRPRASRSGRASCCRRLRYDTATSPRSTAPLSVSGGSSTASPHTISTENAPSRPSIGCSRPDATVRGGSRATSVWRQPTISSNGTFGTLTLTTNGSPAGASSSDGDDDRADAGRGVPVLVGDHLVPALALDAVAGDGLADGDAARAAVARRQRGADRARVVDRPPDVGARVDAGHDEVDGSEHAEAGEHHAQAGRAVHGPRLRRCRRRRPADLRLQQVQGTERGAGAGVLGVRRDDDDVAERHHRPGQHVEADGVDAVVVRDQDPRHARQARVVPIGSDRRT